MPHEESRAVEPDVAAAAQHSFGQLVGRNLAPLVPLSELAPLSRSITKVHVVGRALKVNDGFLPTVELRLRHV
jgi:hypothetical protein